MVDVDVEACPGLSRSFHKGGTRDISEELWAPYYSPAISQAVKGVS